MYIQRPHLHFNGMSLISMCSVYCKYMCSITLELYSIAIAAVLVLSTACEHRWQFAGTFKYMYISVINVPRYAVCTVHSVLWV